MGVITINGKPVNIGGGVLSVAPPDPEIYVTPTEILNVSYLGATCSVNVCGSFNNPTTVNEVETWLVATSPVTPSPSPGTVNNIQICENIGTFCRSGLVCYVPSLGGAVKCVLICQSTGDTNIYLNVNEITDISGTGVYYPNCVRVCGPSTNQTTVSSPCSWIQVCNTPISPSFPTGTLSCIRVCENTGVARQGYVCYTPTVGTTKCVCICQNEAPVYVNLCQIWNSPTNGTQAWADTTGCLCLNSGLGAPVSGCYEAYFSWYMYQSNAYYSTTVRWCLICNFSCICGCSSTALNSYCWGNFNRTFDYNDTVCFCLYAETDGQTGSEDAYVAIQLFSVNSCQTSPNYVYGTYTNIEAYTCYPGW